MYLEEKKKEIKIVIIKKVIIKKVIKKEKEMKI